MFKFVIVVLSASLACVLGKPGIFAPVSYSAPLVAAPAVVTATSSQFVARNYNGLAAAKLVATAPIAYASPAAALASPLVYSSSAFAPVAVGTAPLKYTAVPAVATAPLAAPLKYTAAPAFAAAPLAAPLKYTAAPVLI